MPNRPSDRVVLLFPGQGARHFRNVTVGLCEIEPVFAGRFDKCAAGSAAELGIDLREEVFNGYGSDLERTDRAQPALFAVEYALGQLIDSYGVRGAALQVTASVSMRPPRWRACSIWTPQFELWRCARG